MSKNHKYKKINKIVINKPYPTEEPINSLCDYGDRCNGKAVIWIWDPDYNGWEPACEEHRVIDHYGNPWPSAKVNEICRKTGIQNCSFCNDLNCGDNLSKIQLEPESSQFPCPHGRSHWQMCPHCLGLNNNVPINESDWAITTTCNNVNSPHETITTEIQVKEKAIEHLTGLLSECIDTFRHILYMDESDEIKFVIGEESGKPQVTAMHPYLQEKIKKTFAAIEKSIYTPGEKSDYKK